MRIVVRVRARDGVYELEQARLLCVGGIGWIDGMYVKRGVRTM